MPSFDIILTSFNRLEYTKRTVATLISSGAFHTCQRFIVVDNHSTEPGVEDFLNELAKYKNTFILRRPTNDGWGMAVNDALAISRAEYVLLSNNDVEYSMHFIGRMFRAFEAFADNPIGILGVWRHTAHSVVENGWSRTDFQEMTDVPAVGWLIWKPAMEKAGMLPEHGPCATKGGNGEDTEYVQRMKACGFLVGVLGEDVALHIDGY